MPSTLVEFIEKDEIVEEESNEFEGEFEMEEIVDMNSIFFIFSIIYYDYKTWNTKQTPKIETNDC